MCADIMRQVTGCHWDGEPARLQGFLRRAVKGEAYPALVPDTNGMVNGVVYRDVPTAIWKRLDWFEGEMYSRRSVQVMRNDQILLPAATYVLRPQFLDCLEPHDWDFAGFLRDKKAAFQQDCRRWIQ